MLEPPAQNIIYMNPPVFRQIFHSRAVCILIVVVNVIEYKEILVQVKCADSRCFIFELLTHGTHRDQTQEAHQTNGTHRDHQTHGDHQNLYGLYGTLCKREKGRCHACGGQTPTCLHCTRRQTCESRSAIHKINCSIGALGRDDWLSAIALEILV